MLSKILNWLRGLFNGKKELCIGIYGLPNAGKTTLANRISMDLVGEQMGSVSPVPHETRVTRNRNGLELRVNGKKLKMSLLDMPGIAEKVDYHDFLAYEIAVETAQERAREATKGIIEAVKWLEKIDAAILVMDSGAEPEAQVNGIILSKLEARNVPTIIVANKVDLPNSNAGKVRYAFQNHDVIEVSALTGKNTMQLYEAMLSKFT